MDKIYIESLRVDTTIGVFEWEKAIKQTLIFTIEMGWNINTAAQDDDLSYTLDYAQISSSIDTFCQENPVELIETLAQRLAQYLMETYQIPWLKINISKPGAVPNATTVGVEIERGARS